MSASQCRLLTLTARMSDLEYRAQSVSNSKLQLATKSDAIARDYSAALDKKKLTVLSSYDTSTGTPNYIDATAYNLTTYNAISPLDKQRFLQDSDNKVLISENIKAAFESSNGNLVEFLTSLGYTPDDQAGYISFLSDNFQQNLSQMSINCSTIPDIFAGGGSASAGPVVSDLQEQIQALSAQLDEQLQKAFSQPLTCIAEAKEQLELARQALNQFMAHPGQGSWVQKASAGLSQAANYLTANSITQSVQDSNASFIYTSKDAAAIEYYANVFNQIQQYGYSCPGDANMKDSEWLYAQLTAGNVHLSIFNRALNEGEGGFSEVPWKTGDASLKIDDDDSTLAKAEAEYNIKTSEMQSIDKRYDLQLKQIDTEHSALQTEYDAVKKVVDKNIELSFKAFG